MPQERILIVEDSMIVSLHLKSLLENEGYHVIGVCDTAEEAVKVAEESTPDLVFMDIMLAGEMTGIEAAEIIYKKHKTPILFLSALSDKNTIESAKLTAPFSFITKPFEERDVLNRITLALYKSSLEKENERLRMAYIIEGQEMERARVSRELHDGLGQILNAIKLQLEAIDPACSGEIREKTIHLIRQALHESRRIHENLLPSRLLDFSLVNSLEELCRELCGPNLEVVFQTQDFSQPINEQQKLALYRIAQEALQNAIKHSGCRKIIVQLYQTDEHLQLTIEDDGQGFNTSENLPGRGLSNIRFRSEAIKGKLQIESNPKYGTLLSVSAPIHL